MSYSKIGALLTLLTFSGYSQMSPMMGNPNEIEPVAINYAYIPDLGGTEVNDYGINLNFAKPIGKSMIGVGVGYQYINFAFDEATNEIDLSSYEEFHLARFNLFFRRSLDNNWGIMFSGGTSLMSNLEGDLNSEDFVYTAIVGATKNWGTVERNSSLLIGAFYGTQFGEPAIFPAISYRQKLNEHWSYTLGVPITGINYQINKKHRLSLFASPQGIFGNNSGEVRVEGNRVLTNTKIQFNGINTRLSYRYMLTKSFALVTEGGFVPAATLQILDNDNEEIFDLDPGGGVFVNVGLRYVLNRNPPQP